MRPRAAPAQRQTIQREGEHRGQHPVDIVSDEAGASCSWSRTTIKPSGTGTGVPEVLDTARLPARGSAGCS